MFDMEGILSDLKTMDDRVCLDLLVRCYEHFRGKSAVGYKMKVYEYNLIQLMINDNKEKIVLSISKMGVGF